MVSEEELEIIRFENVNFVRDACPILVDINFVIRRGEHWVLLGPNGAGKCTILSLCGASKIPSNGSIDILGKTIGRVDIRHLRESIGHVNPAHVVQSALDVMEVVLTGATGTSELMIHWSPDADTLEYARRLIEMMGLKSRQHALWNTLSQGERTRTLIARALVCKPKLLLLDEPCSGLDVAAREQFLKTIDEMHSNQPDLTTVMVTHHLEELPTSTTNALLIRDGSIKYEGEALDVLTSEKVSSCFSYLIDIEYNSGRWHAHTSSNIN
jgi:iron complex transport system ATP-binding protein